MKKLLTGSVFVAVIAAYTLHAQVTPSVEWQKSLGGSGSDAAVSIQQITGGGFIVTGISNSNDGDVTGNHGNWDYWIIKLDTSGNIEWQKSLGGSDGDEAFSIQETTDGGFIVAGFSNSSNGDVSENKGSSDYWIVRTDSAGNLLWQKSYGGSNQDQAFSIQQTIEGGFIIAGFSTSTDGDISVNNGLRDYWVVKADSAGNLVWQKSYGGSSDDMAFSIQQTLDGGFIVAGFSQSLDGDILENHGGADYWILKLDGTGNISWQKSLGGSSDDYAYSIQQTTDEGFIVGGESWSNDGDVSGNHGQEDYWIVKLNSAGNVVWQKSLGGTQNEEIGFVNQTGDGGFIVAGGSFSNNNDVSGNHGSADYWIAKLDTAGNLVWKKSLGGSDYDDALFAQQTTDGGFVIAGESLSNDYDVSGNHGSWDGWIVKLSSDIPTGIATSSNNFISVSPNPVRTQLTINLTIPSDETTVQVYDLQGRIIVLPTTIKNTQAQLNTTVLPNGFYTLHVIDNKRGMIGVKKFVKQ